MPSPLQFHILTLFPSLFDSVFSDSILSKAIGRDLIRVKVHALRDFTTGKHKTADDIPYGGGPGMVMKPEPIFAAMENVMKNFPHPKTRGIYFSPQGRVLKQEHLKDYLAYDQLILLCGRYVGVDERVIEGCIDEEVSIRDYVLTGGELPAMVFVDAVSRLIPGVLGCAESLEQESFSSHFLEYPQYTRPPEFRGMKVPEVLVSGNHAEIAKWRAAQAKSRTKERRPDLMK